MGFGKSSLAVAFDSIKPSKLVVEKDNKYKNNELLDSSLSLTIDGVAYSADINNNTISPVIEPYVINTRTRVHTFGKSTGAFHSVSGYLDIEDIELSGTIPPSATVTYQISTITSAAKTKRGVLKSAPFLFSDEFVALSGDVLPSLDKFSAKKRIQIIDDIWSNINSINGTAFLPNTSDKKEVNSMIRQWIGYGYPEFEKSLLCNKQRVTVVGFSELKSGKAHVYKLPLPTSLQGRKIKRRLTVTLAWMSPIVPQNQKYRKARLWFETTDNSEIADSRTDITQFQAVRRGTLQHEVFEEEKRYPYGEDDTLGIKINCAEDAGSFDDPIKYAIAVSLEFGEGVQLDLFDNIYEDIREKLRPRIPIITEIH